MQFPESWLREFCNPPLDTQGLADLLTRSGMEVEELRPVAPPFTGVVVGHILSAEPHPSADRLRVCRVDVGAHAPDGPLQIVCGAPNARAGLKAPLALVGAVLPPVDGKAALTIGAGRLRGVESFGMLCSARELGIADDHGGLLELRDDAVAGTDVRALLALDDTLITLKLTPNLGHALSVFGIAREVAALTGQPLKSPAFPPVAPRHDATLPVKVLAPDLCGRFSGRIVRGVNPQARTPGWMVDRLARCGQRSVSALVDISNYVMFELGRPSHIFDLDKIHGHLEVRWGRPGERLELLNGNTIEVDAQVGVIADAAQVESLAGIMGGEATAVGDATRNIYVEAAFWWPEAVSGRSRRYAFSTDAGHRFERGVDPSTTVEHIERITQLVLDICGGEPGPMTDQVLSLPAREPVPLRVPRASRVIGMPLTVETCRGVFERLGMPARAEGEVLQVTPPAWRFDLALEEDLIEEVIRVLGYDQLPDVPPLAPVTARVRSESHRNRFAVRHALAGLGYQEAITFSFVEERWERELAGNADPIRVLNPIASPLSVMRSSLVGSLIEALRHNLARRAGRVRLFEVGRVFRRAPEVKDGPLTVAGVDQPVNVAGLAYGPADGLQWSQRERAVDFYDAKGDVEALLAPGRPTFRPTRHPALHPGRAAEVWLDDERIGVVGELHPRWRQAYELPQAPVLFELSLAALQRLKVPQFEPVARQQAVQRDIALIVSPEVTHDALMAALTDDETGILRQALLFDVYRPAQAVAGMVPGERSLAVRLELLDETATLSDERIEGLVQAAVARAAARLGARLRG